jgi:RNA polymerase sigma-70 factor (ECF subfamily)
MDYEALSPYQLVQCCLETVNDNAWEEFLNRFHPLITTVVARTARRWNVATPTLLEDLAQEVYLKLCADHCQLLRDFHGIHADSLFAYLKVTTSNLVQDHFKAHRARKRGSGCVDQSLELLDPPVQDGGSGTREEIEQGVLLKQIGEILAAAGYSRWHQAIFWLYYRRGYTAQALAAIPAVDLTVKGVESLLQRMARSVRDRVALTAADVHNDAHNDVHNSDGSTLPISPWITTSAMASSGVGSRLTMTSAAPCSFASDGNPAAGYTTSDDPTAMNTSQSSAAAVARRISCSGMA